MRARKGTAMAKAKNQAGKAESKAATKAKTTTPRKVHAKVDPATLPDDPAQLTELGDAHLREGSPADVAFAVACYKKAAQLDSPTALGRLSAMFRLGEGVRKDTKRAFQCALRAAELGSPTAMYDVAVHYRNGIGVNQSNSEAVAWYRKSAEAGCADAQSALGYAYFMGILDLKRDMVQAECLLRQAAAQDFPTALSNLGALIADGVISGTWEEGIDMLRRGAVLGSNECRYNLFCQILKHKERLQDPTDTSFLELAREALLALEDAFNDNYPPAYQLYNIAAKSILKVEREQANRPPRAKGKSRTGRRRR